MDLQINKWGNSLAVRLPQELIRQLGGLNEGDRVHAEAIGPARLGFSVDTQALAKRKAWLAELAKLHQAMAVTAPLTKDELSRY